MAQYIIGIDQSTQGTKALLFDAKARLLAREDLPHAQKVSPEGYISHDPEEIYQNTVKVVEKLIRNRGIKEGEIAGIGISNQRETTVCWNRSTGKPVCDAVVWQCARAEGICRTVEEEEKDYIRQQTGIPLSPYFPAAKMAWILENHPEARALADQGQLCMGTVDSWLLFCMTDGKVHKTDYSNASRTQLLNLNTLAWDERICTIFGIPMNCLPEVADSNAFFGETDLGGILTGKVPVHAMLGDSHGALYGQGCHTRGRAKATYGTGSSLMMNTGSDLILSEHGIVTSLAWGIDGKVSYCLEGNLNYTGALISWLKEDLGLIRSAGETQELALAANPEDTTYLVPAFSGLGAPYWKSDARAMLCGMNRRTGRQEIVRAALDCIAYQIKDVLNAMEQDSGLKLEALWVDGGPTRNRYLMQFQSDMAGVRIRVPHAEELSGIGAAYLAGITLGIFTEKQAFGNLRYREYVPEMSPGEREKKYKGWKDAVARVLLNGNFMESGNGGLNGK